MVRSTASTAASVRTTWRGPARAVQEQRRRCRHRVGCRSSAPLDRLGLGFGLGFGIGSGPSSGSGSGCGADSDGLPAPARSRVPCPGEHRLGCDDIGRVRRALCRRRPRRRSAAAVPARRRLRASRQGCASSPWSSDRVCAARAGRGGAGGAAAASSALWVGSGGSVTARPGRSRGAGLRRSRVQPSKRSRLARGPVDRCQRLAQRSRKGNGPASSCGLPAAFDTMAGGTKECPHVEQTVNRISRSTP
jgi:hypothetical protein